MSTDQIQHQDLRTFNQPLYHVCSCTYVPGQIKPAGTYWSRLVAAGYSQTNDTLGEFLREEVRALKFNHLPSRMRSSFAFEDLADAKNFLAAFRPTAKIYKVRLADPGAPIHRVTWSAFNLESGAPAQIQAIEYWNGSMLYSSNVELFAESDLVFL